VLLASITGPLVNLAIHAIRTLGLAGVLALTAMTGVVGVPGSEPTMLFAGFNVYQHHLTLPGIIIFGAIGDTLGACVAYAIGFFGSRELLEHQGRRLHIRQSGLDRAERWFSARGSWVMLVSRFIPFARSAFPYAAGVGRMAFARFVVLTAIGSVIWVAALGVLGKAVGQSWQTWRHHLEYADYAGVALCVLLIAYVIVMRRRRAGAPPQPPTESAGGDGEPTATAVDAATR
jgi:membrane protein DedA with SNARE-associated domain